LNLTKTVRKFPLDPDLAVVGSPMMDKVPLIMDHEPEDVVLPDEDIAEPISQAHFEETLNKYDIGEFRVVFWVSYIVARNPFSFCVSCWPYTQCITHSQLS
jgi:hypothetical protein